MILPIIAYGHPDLRKVGAEVEKNNKEIETVIADMWETMYQAKGVGLAAPQIGKIYRLFIVDTIQIEDDLDDEKGIKKVFLNARVLKRTGDEWAYNEGCLSIPQIREDVLRKEQVLISYQDENFNKFEEEFSGVAARVILHEYDHIEGILFTDHLKPLRKRMLHGKLDAISKGKISVDYKMIFPNAKKKVK